MKSALAALLLLISCVAAQAQTVCALPCLITGTEGPRGPVGPSGGGNLIPGGRLTLVSATPVMSADATSTTLFYAPYNSDTFPVLDATLTWQVTAFSASPVDQIGASMSGGAKWTAGSSRDVFGTISGVICTGPAWPSSDLPSRNILRYSGVLVNSTALTCDTSASASIACPQYQCTYLGSINPSVTGQLTATFSTGQDRKFETWTAYDQNQVDIVMHVNQIIALNGYMPTNQYPTMAYFNNSALNRAIAFTGLPVNLDVEYYQSAFVNSGSGPSGIIAAVCLNGLTYVGYWAKYSSDNNIMVSGFSGSARYNNSASIGKNTLAMCVAKANAATSTVWGSSQPPNYSEPEINSMMLVRYRG